MTNRLFYIVMALLLGEVIWSEIHFIPSIESINSVLYFLSLGAAFLLGLLYLVLLWRSEKSSKAIHTSVMIATFIFTFLYTMPPFFEPEYVLRIDLNNDSYYIYNQSCFPPDGMCECSNYGSFIYMKNKYLPMMRLVAKTDFYVDDIEVFGDVLTAIASDDCEKDKGKEWIFE